MRTLNVVGCGRAGKTLARLFARQHAFSVQDLMDVNLAAARACAQFAETGRPVRRIAELRPAAVWLIATPDAAIVDTVAALVDEEVIARGNVVVHLSGATPSLDMVPAIERGAHAGSFHPLTTFADPGYAAGAFAGTYVALEGDRKALKVMRPALRKIGARVFEIAPENKVVYHAASVIVCNYLVALLETGLRAYERAGIGIETGYKLIEPLVRETVNNVFRSGTVRALTGPIARGDHEVVARQLARLGELDPRLAAVYRHLGVIALELARSQGGAEPRSLARIGRVLKSND